MWSKVKKNMMRFLAPIVAEHLDIHCAKYSNRSRYMWRIWCTWDKEEMLNAADPIWHPLYYKMMVEGKEPTPELVLAKQHIYSGGQFLQAMENYPNLSMDAILTSEDPIIQALGMFDQRLGWRRLQKLEKENAPYPIVNQFLALRVSLEREKRDGPEARERTAQRKAFIAKMKESYEEALFSFEEE